MRIFRHITLYFLLSALIIAVHAQDSTLIEFSSNTLDFNAIYEADGTIPLEFKYKNTGNSPLKINRILSHGFKNIQYNNQLVAPGQSESIKLTLDPFGKSGYFEKTIIVFSNSKNSPTELTVKGKILNGTYRNSFKSEIGGLGLKQLQLNFGYIFKGDVTIRYIPVMNNSESSLDVFFHDIPEHLDIAKRFKQLQPGESGLIEITYNTNKLNDWDFVIDKINMEVKGQESVNGVFMVSANIRENFMLLSEEERLYAPKVAIPIKVFNYDTIFSGNKVTAKFTVYNRGSRELNIRSVKPTCGCTAALPEKNLIAPNDSTVITVQFDSFGFSGLNKKGVTVISNDPNNYKQFLWITGYIE